MVFQAVDLFKASSKKIEPPSAKPKRFKVTEFIACQKSRQEYLSLVGKLIGKSHIELLLKEAAAKSNIPHTGYCLLT